MFVIGVLVVGGCYRRVLQSSFAHINVDMLPVAFLVLRLLSTDQFHPFRLAYSGGINNTRRMLALPTLIALSFVGFFASAGMYTSIDNYSKRLRLIKIVSFELYRHLGIIFTRHARSHDLQIYATGSCEDGTDSSSSCIHPGRADRHTHQ
jgi:hypothetical protein